MGGDERVIERPMIRPEHPTENTTPTEPVRLGRGFRRPYDARLRHRLALCGVTSTHTSSSGVVLSLDKATNAANRTACAKKTGAEELATASGDARRHPTG